MISAPRFTNANDFSRTIGRVVVLASSVLLSMSVGRAGVVLDSGYSTNSYTTVGNGTDLGSKAVLFEATESFGTFTTLQLGLFLGGLSYAEDAGNVAINLYSSTGSPPDGAIPDSLLTTLATIPIASFNGTQQGNFWSGTNLTSGSRPAGWYWLVVDTSAVSANSGALNWAIGVQGSDTNRGAYFDTYASPQVWTQAGMPLPSGFAEIVSVPEPSTYAMALAGLVCGGFGVWRRRLPGSQQTFRSSG